MGRAAQALAELHDRRDDQRRADETHHGQHGIEDEQIHRQADERDRLLQQIAHARRHRGLNRVGIRYDPADHLTGRPFGKEAMALADDPFVKLIPEIANRREADFLEGVLGCEGRDRADHEDDQQDGKNAAPFQRRIGIPPAIDALFRAIHDRQMFRDQFLRRGHAPIRRGLDARAGRRQHFIEERLHHRREHGLRQREDDHRAERHHRPPFVGAEVAIEPAEDLHRFTIS